MKTSKVAAGILGAAALSALVFNRHEDFSPHQPSSQVPVATSPLDLLKVPTTLSKSREHEKKFDQFLKSVLNDKLSPSDELAKELFDYQSRGLVHKSTIERVTHASQNIDDKTTLMLIISDCIFTTKSLDAWLDKIGFTLEQKQDLAQSDNDQHLKAGRLLVEPHEKLSAMIKIMKENGESVLPGKENAIPPLYLSDIEDAIAGFKSLDPDCKFDPDSYFWAPVKTALDAEFQRVASGYEKFNTLFAEQDKFEIPLPEKFDSYEQYYSYLSALQSKLFTLQDIQEHADSGYLSPALSRDLIDRITNSQNPGLGYEIKRQMNQVIRGEPDLESPQGIERLKINLDSSLRSFLQSTTE